MNASPPHSSSSVDIPGASPRREKKEADSLVLVRWLENVPVDEDTVDRVRKALPL